MRSSLLVRESRREAVPSLTLRASGLRGVGPLVLSPRADLRRGILPRPRAHEVQGGEDNNLGMKHVSALMEYFGTKRASVAK